MRTRVVSGVADGARAPYRRTAVAGDLPDTTERMSEIATFHRLSLSDSLTLYMCCASQSKPSIYPRRSKMEHR